MSANSTDINPNEIIKFAIWRITTATSGILALIQFPTNEITVVITKEINSKNPIDNINPKDRSRILITDKKLPFVLGFTSQIRFKVF